MSEFVIYSYNGAGQSMRWLSAHLGNAPIVTRRHPNWQEHLNTKILVNYGASYLQGPWDISWFNDPQAIKRAVDKLRTFEYLRAADVRYPDYTTTPDVVRAWLLDGSTVYARATATGSEGRGINILSERHANIPPAAFYSRAINHDEEYRVHVVRGRVITTGRKYAKEYNANRFIRNMKNGWAFRLHITAPPSVDDAGLRAVNALRLDFGAADVAYRHADNAAIVLEVNTAPTMAESTARCYAQAFQCARGGV